MESGPRGNPVAEVTNHLMSRQARLLVHDLRNPLAVIRGYLQVASRSSDPKDPDGLHSYLDGALAATTELDEMIQSMLDLAVLEDGNYEPTRSTVELDILLRMVEKRLRPWVIQESRELVLELPVESIQISGDAVFLERAIKNLVMHAMRRAPVGSKVILYAEAAGGGVRIDARDQGAAVPESSIPTYFDPSSQEDRRELGWKADRAFAMACVRKVAEGHGGSVGIESGPEGTTFFMRLPVECQEKPSPRPSPFQGEGVPSPRRGEGQGEEERRR